MKKYVFLAFLIIFGTAILSGAMTYKKNNKKTYNNITCIPQNVVENMENTSQVMPLEEQIISDTNTDDVIKSQEENIEQAPVVKSTSKEKQNRTSTPQITVVKEQPVTEAKQQSVTEVKQRPIEEVEQESTKIKEKNNKNTPQTKEETIQTIPEAPKKEVVTEQPVITGEEYKTNNSMINTLKSVINSNQSDDMKLYGYNIVIDSSIVNITSQFTYTEQRVIDKIKYKFGTIRIFARDYYNNGEYICTQCYII